MSLSEAAVEIDKDKGMKAMQHAWEDGDVWLVEADPGSSDL